MWVTRNRFRSGTGERKRAQNQLQHSCLLWNKRLTSGFREAQDWEDRSTKCELMKRERFSGTKGIGRMRKRYAEKALLSTLFVVVLCLVSLYPCFALCVTLYPLSCFFPMICVVCSVCLPSPSFVKREEKEGVKTGTLLRLDVDHFVCFSFSYRCRGDLSWTTFQVVGFTSKKESGLGLILVMSSHVYRRNSPLVPFFLSPLVPVLAAKLDDFSLFLSPFSSLPNMWVWIRAFVKITSLRKRDDWHNDVYRATSR